MAGNIIDGAREIKFCYDNNPGVSSFFDVKTVQPRIVQTSTHVRKSRDYLYAIGNENGGSQSYDVNNALVNLTVTGTNGSRAIRKVRRTAHYVPATAVEILITSEWDSNTTDFAYVIRRNGTDNVKASTNVGDGLPLNGPSVPILSEIDITAPLIWKFSHQWLGVGSSVLDLSYAKVDSSPNPLRLHNNRFAGVATSTGTYLSNPDNSVTWEIINDNGTIRQRVGFFDDNNGWFVEGRFTGSGGTMKAICSAVLNYGDTAQPTFATGAITDGTNTVSSTTFGNLVTIRAKSGVRNLNILPTLINAISSSSDEVVAAVLLNADFNSALTWTSSGDDSDVEFSDTDTDVNMTDAQVRSAALVYGASSAVNREINVEPPDFQRFGYDINGNPDTLSLVCNGLNSSASMLGVMNWIEF